MTGKLSNANSVASWPAAALLLALKARASGTFGVMTVDEYLIA